MRGLAPLLVGAFTGAVLWAVTGFFVTSAADLSGYCCAQVTRGLLVPGAAVGGLLFLVAALVCPPGRAEASSLALGMMGGAVLGLMVGIIADILMGMASTGILPSYTLALAGTSAVTGAGAAWFGGWLTTERSRQRSPRVADGVEGSADPGAAADRGVGGDS
ncbi:hypothetical protein [Urbifossiella limnaea]|uniref:Uncharacterized protein n=1 Tax=Urbifossiella limnaea TaxID=2528023 RepID=A0A517XUF9_9BACT|nr:hypothetical protein [Urbifossiella limnaea]QDU21126.1 hypothetical protein ETAA1_30910 [Urbifossiella limnaea]